MKKQPNNAPQGLRPPGNLGTLPAQPASPARAAPAPFAVPAGLLAGAVLFFALLGGVVLLLERADEAAYCARVRAGEVPQRVQAYQEMCEREAARTKLKP